MQTVGKGQTRFNGEYGKTFKLCAPFNRCNSAIKLTDCM